MFKKCYSFLINNKHKINNGLPIIFTLIFLFSFLPNLTRVPFLSSFIVSYAVIWRAVGAILGFLYFLIVFIANEFIIEKKCLYVSCALAVVTLISLFANINQSVFSTYTNQYAKIVETTRTYGYLDPLTFLFNNIWGCLLFLFLFGIYPKIDKTNKIRMLPFMILILIMTINVVYCVITERNSILNILKGNFNLSASEGLHALFPSKNAFGLFLFQGLILSFYLFIISKKKWLLAFIIVFVLFSFLSLCKSSAVCIIFFGLACSIFSLIKFKRRFVFNICLSIALGCLVVFFILFVSIPALHSGGFLLKLYNFLFVSTSDNRSGVASTVLYNIKGGYYVSGYAHSFLDYLNAWIKGSGGWVNDLWSPHNSYVSMIGYRGLLGLAVYLLILGYVFYSYVAKVKNYRLKSFLIAALVSIIGYGFFEDDVLFITSSANTLLLSIMFAGEYKIEVEGKKYEINV